MTYTYIVIKSISRFERMGERTEDFAGIYYVYTVHIYNMAKDGKLIPLASGPVQCNFNMINASCERPSLRTDFSLVLCIRIISRY